ncbi:universal stress protein [Salarchaeum sp. JOR-1]|uniref:universal stress protein n=1 Tax=Salarchaeum sp. JOR-1 TaxID=2599399 RepID=UPI00119895CA|nr:universal stress protein [Salarchaeum sp. JOR-1]QDX40608.1 universal stress protein [Salarchaeum sp. JOR-1]
MYDRILLATDGSEASAEAVEHAVALAEATGATLHALYVVDEDVYSAYSGDEYVQEHEGLESGLVESGEDALAAVESAADDVDVVTELVHGRPSDEILAYGNEHDVDLIVVGTRERSAAYRNLLGSVTERVVRIASRPVTVVKTQVD